MAASTPAMPLWAARVVRFSLPPLVLKVAGHGFGYRALVGYWAVIIVTLFGTVLLMQRIPGSGDGYPSGGSWRP